MPLSNDEIDRYKRHLLLRDVGGAGQQKLKAARVLIIGAGGLGSPVAMYLAAAGIGTIGIIDDDRVSLDNLQRQIIHATADINRPKVDSARQTINALNPHVNVKTYETRFTADNAFELLSDYDIVADGSDNFETRYLVNDACYLAEKPLVFAALGPFDGHLATFRAFEKDSEGTPFPSYRCIFPEAPPPGTVAPCSEAGILGAVAGVLGTMQALEVLKEILEIGQSLAGKLVLYDAKSTMFQTISLKWDPDNPLNGKHPIYTDLSHHKRITVTAN